MTERSLNPCVKSRCRQVMLMGGPILDVPKYIHRIDTRTSHGWRVCYSKPFRFFSDNGSSIEGALKQAKRHLKEIYP